MATKTEAKRALLDRVSNYFDRVDALLGDSPNGTKFTFETLGTTIGESRMAVRAVMVDSGKTDEEGNPILVAKTETDDKGVTHRITERKEVVEPADLTRLIAEGFASVPGYSLENHGKNAGLWVGEAPKATPANVATLKSRIAELEALLAAKGA